MKSGEASRNQSGKAYNLSDAEKIRLGLKKPATPKGTIHVVIPMHYGAKGVWWESRYITPAEFLLCKAAHPNMQVIDGAKEPPKDAQDSERMPTREQVEEARKGMILWH